MEKRTAHKIFRSGLAVVSGLLLCMQLFGYLAHSHEKKNKQHVSDATPKIEEECAICLCLHLPLSPLHGGPEITDAEHPELPGYSCPLCQAVYFAPEFATNPKSPPFLS